MKLNELSIDKTWTLFLDRDGVINLHYPNDYVKKWDEFYFLESVLDALKNLSTVFKRIIVVTNQQGVGKKLMTEDDLQLIHDEMLKEVRKYGGRIHAIYSATDLITNDVQQLRKGIAKIRIRRAAIAVIPTGIHRQLHKVRKPSDLLRPGRLAAR